MAETFESSAVPSSLQRRLEELQERASKDALSGLLNRVSMEQYIKKRLQSMGPEETCALFIIDLDNFKQVNDTLGHQAGDQAIRQAAQILSDLFRAKDIVGRLGGDEFAVFLAGEVTEKLVRKKAAAICSGLQLVLGGSPAVNLTASVGVYIAAGNLEHFEGLYQSADLALYRAKKSGKHSFYVKRSEGVPESGEEFRPVSSIPLTGLLEYMDSGVALLEMGDPISLIYVSPSFCRILGVDSQRYAMPKPLDKLVHPDDRLELEKVLRGGLRRDAPVEHTHRVSLDGKRWAWWHVRAVRIEYDNPYPVMLVTTTDISRYKENERRLQEINQRLQIAFNQTTQSLWEVDLQTWKFRLFAHEGQFADPGEGWVTFPESLISIGWVHPDSAPRFQEFADELLRGRVQGYGNFIIQYRDTGCYGWAALSYRMLYDETGRPARAVGIVENMPQNFVGQETRSILQRPLPGVQMSDMIVYLRANLTQNAVQELWVEGRDQSAQAGEAACTRILQRAREKLYRPEDRERLAGYFDRETLLEEYRRGQRWQWAEYQRVDAGGSICWVNHAANLVEDPLTREIYLFLYLSRADARHGWEQLVNVELRRDPVTRLYERGSVRAMAEAILQRGGSKNCAVALIYVGGLMKRYMDDPDRLNRKRFYGAMALSVSLGSGCILGQYSTDQVVAFFPEVRSRPELRGQLEDAFAFTRLVLAGAVNLEGLRLVAGVVLEPVREANYGSMAAQAYSQSQMWRSAAADTVVFPHQDDDWAWMEIQTDRREDQVTVHHTEMNRPLSEGEKDVAFRCMSAMLSADSLEASLHSVLNYIGSYYHADRVYILTLGEDQHTVTMPFEWNNLRKHSIQQVVSGTAVERFPILKRCMEERAPVFLTRTRPISLQGERAAGAPWYFTAFPLEEPGGFRGFLCIENSREHPADAALFSTLIPYILRERGRFHSQGSPEKDPAANLLGLPNLRSYMEIIYTLNSDRYSSMGAVCVDIPGLSAINSSLGFEYGGKLLWYVSKALADIFGPNWIFRTWDTEFVALSPNTTSRVFEDRCARLSAILRRRYPKELRIGHTWADGMFYAKNLVNEARGLMHAERAEAAESADELLLDHGHFRSVGEAARGGRFTVYFQPKVDMSTGALVGAEALVRGVDDEGSLTLPGQFIGRLEKSGGIRELDLFVLDQALSQVERWREAGRGIVPISVNLSRATLFSPTALASILAVQSRYPKVPPEALELEITESVGDVEADALQAVVDQFRQCGLRFSLDDFGSKYANLSIFTNVKFDTVKLDRSLITELTGNPINQMLVRDIVRICKTYGMTCVAEGVESREQADALQKAGCLYAQGYYYDRPMPAEQFEGKYLSGGTPREHTI